MPLLNFQWSNPRIRAACRRLKDAYDLKRGHEVRISRALGGVHIHSCGNYAHNLDNLLAIPGIRSIQLHAGPAEFALPASALEDHPLNRARGKVALLVDFTPVSLGDAYRGRPRQMYEEYVLPRLKSGNLDGLILQSCGPAGPGAAGAVDWVRRQVARSQYAARPPASSGPRPSGRACPRRA